MNDPSLDAPIVGLATQTLQPIPGQVPLAWVMGQQYVRALCASGALPWIIPLLADRTPMLRAIYERLDGIFLVGGVDIEPTAYGEARIEQCGASDRDRDLVETQLLHWAKADRKPVFGVCRGAQIINVAFGGTLYQDLKTQEPEAVKHDYFPQQGYTDRGMLAHDVAVAADSRLHDILGGEVRVNSMHHQGVKTLGDGLRAVAHAPDGVVEGVEGENGQYMVGVQWHPEELLGQADGMRRLFDSFVAAARDFRSRKPAGAGRLPADVHR